MTLEEVKVQRALGITDIYMIDGNWGPYGRILLKDGKSFYVSPPIRIPDFLGIKLRFAQTPEEAHNLVLDYIEEQLAKRKVESDVVERRRQEGKER